MIRLIAACTLLVFVMGFSDTSSETKKPLNIILLIGDGMGLAQVSVPFYFQEDSSSFYRFPIVGLAETSSASRPITDSAAGATALASGVNTYSGAIGVNRDSAEVESIVEILSKRGWKTGFVVTSTVQHATPASFYAHVDGRHQYEEITEHLVTSDIDFFAGGGIKYFTQRKDSVNYLYQLTERGFTWDTTALATKLDANKKYGFLLADNGLPKMSDGRGNYLSDATKLALHYFTQSKKPFFLMVEGSQIDWGGHQNDAPYLIAEMLDFDKVIDEVLDFAQKDGNTLVIVTADHETGGFALGGKNNGYDEITPTFSTTGHTATLIPVFAFGPGAESFGGVYKNSAIFHKMLEAVK
jgi:alkaline phosphatase